MKEIRLIMVTAVNNNKFYTMKEDPSGGTFTATWGRVDVTSKDTVYPMSKWDGVYKSKVKKGYVDQTDLFIEEEEETTEDNNTHTIIQHNSPAVSTFVTRLQGFANTSIQTNYTVSAEKVTQRQIDKAQDVLNNIQTEINGQASHLEVNSLLLELYSVVPRRMGKVQTYLIPGGLGHQPHMDAANNRLATEQSNIDVMAGQVKMKDITGDEPVTILDSLGLAFEDIDANDKQVILKLMGPDNGKFIKGFKVANNSTQNKYNNFTGDAKHKRSELFWHGSRNENWWSIINGGLVLRPTNAVISGKMFGYGLYFADKCRKSIGYTSVRGSYWASGSSSTGLLALFEVHLGNPLHIQRHQSWCYDLTEQKLKQRGSYDSLFAEGGIDLMNNEYIVYNENQVTVKYIVEIN